MNPERWRKIDHLFHAALHRPAEERSAFLAQACDGDSDLQHSVELLLAHDSGSAVRETVALGVGAGSNEPLLRIGSAWAHYTISEHLGAGGMGTVYKATDTRLGRQVALKLLHPEVLESSGGPQRFEREARALASLNDPRIAAIYEFDEQEGVPYLALEYVPGLTLADRLRRGPLDVCEALEVAEQIAGGLEAAHACGIIHRDLKPSNIKVGENGKVKILDFGLAKFAPAMQTAAASASTLTNRMAVLGTPEYMSPEQACGKELDSRSDIWAFGCVLYESLTGKSAFRRPTVTETLAAVVQHEPDWDALPPSTPPNIGVLLRRCIQKDPGKRLRHIGDAIFDLDEARTGRLIPATPSDRAAASNHKALVAGAAAGILAGAILVLLAVRYWPQSAAHRDLTRFTVPFAAQEAITPSNSPNVTISPDGRRVAYTTWRGTSPAGQIYIRAVDQQDAKPIAEALGGAAAFFSPDGKWLAFFHGRTQSIRKLAVTGGAPVAVANIEGIAGASWGEDGNIVWGFFDLMSVPAGGGPIRSVLKPDSKSDERFYRQPWYLPGGRAILFTVGTERMETFNDAQIAVVSLATGQKKILIDGGMCPRYSPTGHLVYARAGSLLAVPFDVRNLAVKGQPTSVVDGVYMNAGTGMAAFAISAYGDLAYAPGPVVTAGRLPCWVNRKGVTEPFPLPPRSYLHPRFSPDDRQVAMEIEAPVHDSYTYDISRNALSRFSFDGTTHWPIWTPRGDRIAFRSGRTSFMSMWWTPADRSGSDERLTTVDGNMQTPESWSPDGRSLLFTQRTPNSGADIFVLSMDGDRKPRPLVQTNFDEGAPKFSPDGKWVAYCSNESGRAEVYVTPYPGPGARIQVSTDGGSDPVWRRKGGELYCRLGEKMMVVSVATEPKLSLSKPRVLWEGAFMYGTSSSCGGPGVTSTNYDVTADGERFVMIREKDVDSSARQVNVVLGWGEELKRLAK